MRKDYEKLFTYLATPIVPAGLFDKVMGRIDGAKRLRNLRRRLAFFLVLLSLSLIGFVLAVWSTQSALVQSGFLEFFSLLFSDLGVVLTYWQTYLFSLLEALPVISLIACLATLFALLESLKLIARDITNFSMVNKQYNN
jgi:ABC-type phosphate/phosphonate transport system permease subunit